MRKWATPTFEKRCMMPSTSRTSSLTPQELRDRFRARSDLELFINATDVGVHGFVADTEFVGDFLVEKTFAEAVKHFLFARRQTFGGLGRSARLLKRLHHFAGDMGRHR